LRIEGNHHISSTPFILTHHSIVSAKEEIERGRERNGERKETRKREGGDGRESGEGGGGEKEQKKLTHIIFFGNR